MKARRVERVAEGPYRRNAGATGNDVLGFAFVVNNYPPRVGGVELHVRNLAGCLANQGHNVTVITLAEQPGTATEGGIEVIRLAEHMRVADVLGFPSLGATRRIATLLRERDVDVVSVHTRFFPMSWIGLRAARRAGAAVIHTEHGSDHVASDSRVIRAASRLADFTFGRFVLREATKVVGVSENVVAFVKRLSGRNDASIFYNAIEPASGGIDRTQRQHVAFVGRLVPGKGADVFVQTVKLLADQDLELTAEIVGDGPAFDQIDSLVSSLGLDHRLTMRGRLELDEVSHALAGAVLVNPSTLAEGFQTTLLEALDAGGSIVSFEVPGADVLQGQGFPVDVVKQQTPFSLASAVRARLDSPWPVLSMDEWYWPARAEAYAQLAHEVVSQHRRH